jgi:hypothetical protein
MIVARPIVRIFYRRRLSGGTPNQIDQAGYYCMFSSLRDSLLEGDRPFSAVIMTGALMSPPTGPVRRPQPLPLDRNTRNSPATTAVP